jgi:hypothetical protein
MSDARACAPGGRLARCLMVALLGLMAALVFAVPAGATAGPLNYVSIGDSYTSAPGVTPYEENEVAEKFCGRSTKNYPHLVAAALSLTLTDVSCGGAATKDETEEQIPGKTPPQDDALSESTDIVTIGMGGNDHGLFGTLLNGCTEVDFLKPEPGKSPCKDKYEKYVTETLAQDKPEQEAALKHIKELAPHAKVFVVGYPDIMPKVMPQSCLLVIPWKAADVKWFRGIEKQGDKAIRAGAKANGAIYVETFKPSESHNACEPVGTRWIEPLANPLTGVPVHPNALGEEADAYDVQLAMLKAGVRP